MRRTENKFYWIRLYDDFFSSKRIKKLRKSEGGADLIVIYLKMQLLSLKTNGILTYTGLEESFAEELALDLDENAGDVQRTLDYLKACKLIETQNEIEWILPYAIECTGSEGSSAKRMREFRKNSQASQCSTSSAQCSTSDEQCSIPSAQRYGEKEIEKEIEIEIEIEKDIYSQRFDDFWSKYPKKVGKAAAQKAFMKIKPTKEIFDQMLFTISLAKESDQWTKQNGQFIPNPATWLNQGRWEDDVTTYQRESESMVDIFNAREICK